jgi:hypothetical protein
LLFLGHFVMSLIVMATCFDLLLVICQFFVIALYISILTSI